MKNPVSSYRVGPHVFNIINNSTTDVMEALPSLTPFTTSVHTGHPPLFELHLTEDAEGAMTAEEQNTDFSFDWEDARCIIRPLANTCHIIAITTRKAKKTYCMECTDSFRNCTAYLPAAKHTFQDSGVIPESTIGFVLNNFLMMLYAFNAARHHTLLMHASVVVSDNKGYLFLGKSGTGKSTHSSLWLKQFPECHLLNDDNPVVHVDIPHSQVTVFGSPWSGKTPCYRNESMPVGAFVRLEQAPRNEIKKESTVRAFAALLPSCSCLKPNKEIYGGIVSAVTGLASLVPTFHLKCLPDQKAAMLCRKAVEKGSGKVTKQPYNEKERSE